LPDGPSFTLERFSYDPMNIHRANGLLVKGSWPSHDPKIPDKSAFHQTLANLSCTSVDAGQLDKFSGDLLMDWDLEPTVEGESRSGDVTVRDDQGCTRTARLTLSVSLATLPDKQDLPITRN
jgi:hypothetical protein